MKPTNTAGTVRKLASTARTQRSMSGASHSAARNPRTTEGTAAMISTTGLTARLNPGVVKWLVYTAPNSASGTANSIA